MSLMKNALRTIDWNAMTGQEMDCQGPPLCVEETLSGKGGIVDLWCYSHATSNDAALRAQQEALMTPDEGERHRKFHFERDRGQFLATRALVRTVLSRYAPVTPAEWRFVTGPHGKPRVAHPAVTPPLFFNVSNTPGLVVCAVSVAHQMVGVDVERMDRENEWLAIADRFFSPSEVRALRALPASEHIRRFFACWTLKESYIKARGLGLALPLDQFSFQFEGQDIGVAFDEKLGDDAARWRFALLQAAPPYMMAVGVDTGGAELSLRVQYTVPLAVE
jgi:4'-phosphopantetheinyl transferase